MYRSILLVMFVSAPFVGMVARGSEPGATSHFAAIAYSESMKRAGSSFASSSFEEAQKAAIANCKSDDAKVVISVQNGWCSLAVGKNNVYAGALGATQGEAQSKALSECSEHALGCYILVSLFTGSDTEPRLRREPPTAGEEKMFQKMYGDAGLDEDTIKTVRESWDVATRRERKAEYTQFMAKLKEAIDAATPVDIRIVNPAEYQVPWSYIINGETRNLPSGSTDSLNRRSTIRFNRGGDAGEAEYRLDEGVYKFTSGENGKWDLIRQPEAGGAKQSAEDSGVEAVTPEERKMFQEMYGQVELDAESRKTVEDAWENSTSADRKTQYDKFKAEVQEAVNAAKPVNIRIENPAKNQVEWSYLLDGQSQKLAAGSKQDLVKKSTIKFDRGGGKGETEYSLENGTYRFAPAADGGWQLYFSAEGADAQPSLDPITPEERKMFQEMYGQVDLDADVRKAVEDAWKNSTSAERKAQYEQFKAKVQEAIAADKPVSIRIENPAKNQVEWNYLLDGHSQKLAAGSVQELQKKAVIKFDRGGGKGETEYVLSDGAYTFGPAAGGGWELLHAADDAAGRSSPDPITPAEKRMFHEMYGQVDLDAGTRKAVEDAWMHSSSADRKAQYDQFKAEVREAVAAAEKKAKASNP